MTAQNNVGTSRQPRASPWPSAGLEREEGGGGGGRGEVRERGGRCRGWESG